MTRAALVVASIGMFTAVLFAGSMNEDLFAAARKGDLAAVKALLDKGVDVNAKTEYGATALSFAAEKGHLEVVKLLLDNKADPSVKDTYYKASPMTWAMGKNRIEIMKLLVEAGAEEADAALLYAAQRGNLEFAKLVLEKAKPKQAALDKALAATPKGRTELVEVLTKAGAKAADPAAAKPAVKVAPEILKEYVGIYRNEETMTELKVVLPNERLLVKAGSFQLYSLNPIDDNTFQPTSDNNVTVAFQRDQNKVAAMVTKGGNLANTYKRIEARVDTLAKDDDPPREVNAPANWPQFRGKGATGVAEGQFPPLRWDAVANQNIRWKTPIPGLGHSCPVIWGDRIFLTTAVSGAEKNTLKAGQYGNVDSVNDTSPHTFQVLCLDKASGKILWDQVAHKGVPKVKRHTKATHANSTCATDGKRVVACFGSEGLYCYDFSGKLLWKQELGLLESSWFYDPDYQWGFGSSPIIYQNMAIVQCDAGKNSFLAAFDLNTGNRVWTTPREEVPSWGTPTVIETKDGAELVTNATKFVRGYDPLTGKELWRLGKNSEITVPTPFAAHGLVFVTSGYRNPRPIYAIRPGARGDITLPKGEKSSDYIAWCNEKAGPYMPTPIVYGEHLYVCTNDGVVTCYEATTGKRIWWERLGPDGGFTASPVAADGKIYFPCEDGQTYVLKAGTQFNLLAVNALGDPVLATPAISDGMMFVRTQRYLFGIGRPK